MADQWRFLYRAQLLEVVDGDTITMLLDRGMKDYAEVDVRVRDLWCPELGTPEGHTAATQAFNWFDTAQTYSTVPEWPFLVELHKRPIAGDEAKSFDRYIGDIYGEDLNSFAGWMIANGHGTTTR